MNVNFSPLIEVRELAEMIESNGCVTLDCRFDLLAPRAGAAAFQAGHIPGAHYADLNQDFSSPISASSGRHPLPDPLMLARRLASWGIEPATRVVVYDADNAAMAARGWWLLRWVGIEQAQVLNGGFAAWRAAGRPIEKGDGTEPCHPTVAHWQPRVTKGATVTADAVLAGSTSHALGLIDARSPARFAGTAETIDPIAGHVPGAINVPFTLNLSSDGRFRDAASLRRDWLRVLGSSDASRFAHMCGSGVTACHNLLALEIAGLPGAKLYPGSWSEWIRDPARPIVRASTHQ